MRATKLLVIPLAVLALFATVAVAAADLRQWKPLRLEVAGEEVPAAESMPELRAIFPDPLVCSGCHPQHHASWSRSFHAKSLETAGFQLTYGGYLAFLASAEGRKKLGRDITADDLRQCLFCHAPQVQFASDELVMQISDAIAAGRLEEIRGMEVSCVVCHAINPEGKWATTARRDNGSPFTTFFGPLKDAVPQEMHQSQFSALHTTSELCAICHSQQHFGVYCSLVYDQQQRAEAKMAGNCRQCHVHGTENTCQGCHMKATENVPVALCGGKEDRTRHDHAAPGGRFMEMWPEALDLELQAEARGPDQLVVTVAMRSNVAHNIPDG